MIIRSRGMDALPPLKYPLHHILKTSVLLNRMVFMVLINQKNSLDTSEAFRQFISKHSCIKSWFSLSYFQTCHYYRVASRSWTLIKNKCIVCKKTFISDKWSLSVQLCSVNEMNGAGESRSNSRLLDLHEDLNVRNQIFVWGTAMKQLMYFNLENLLIWILYK